MGASKRRPLARLFGSAGVTVGMFAVLKNHRGCGVELLGDGDEGDAVGIEELDQFGEVGKRAPR
jgi:hypothetical protein